MHRSPSTSGWHEIDGQRVYTDSLMEAAFIKQLVRLGFSCKWRRTKAGLAHGSAKYTPDLELCVIQGGKERLALVEFKPLRQSEFRKEARMRMVGIARHHKPSPALLLYVAHTKKWYSINSSSELEDCLAPVPGIKTMVDYPKPFSIPMLNSHGRSYRITPLGLLVRSLELFFDVITQTKRPRR